MPKDQGLGSPDYMIYNPGKSTFQASSEALDRQEQHADWHEDHPGQFNCPPELSPPGDYAAIERIQEFLMGAMEIEPGEAFAPRPQKGK